ncbi:MAG: hypothetical protein ACFNX1_09285 [Treponema lecithinolyticum]|uniref:hypothetical protein n=1 Tax=Treponema lecithinolyticum TaxID=53418 RepID=UPI00361EDCB4
MKNYANMTLKQNSSAKHLALLKIFALCAVLVLTVLLISACPNAGTQNNGTGGQPLFPGDKEYMLNDGSTTVRLQPFTAVLWETAGTLIICRTT